MYLARIYNVTINITISSETIYYLHRSCTRQCSCFARLLQFCIAFAFSGLDIIISFFSRVDSERGYDRWQHIDHKEGGNRRIHVLLPVVPWYRWETLNTLAYCLTHFHPFGPSVGTDAHVAFGDDEVSPSGHPELLFKLLALLPKVQLTIVSCVPSRSCSSSSSCWLFEAELLFLLYCNHEKWTNY